MARMTLPPGMAMPEVLAALRALGVAIFLWTAKGRQTLEWLWKISPDGIMSDLAGTATEPLTRVRHRTTLAEADQLQRPPTCRPQPSSTRGRMQRPR